MQKELQLALDNLSSPRSSLGRQEETLIALERLFAETFLDNSPEKNHKLNAFIQLQDMFQCNVPSRILSWLSSQVLHLKRETERINSRGYGKTDSYAITSNIIISLSLVQGVALIHNPSKEFLASRYSIEILLELLPISRHITSKPFSNSTNTQTCHDTLQQPRELSLASVVLDTLLCVLVDSPEAMRIFEEALGVEAVVKLLKRAGIPRDVRMKCLEFLYFYLMDENSTCSGDFNREMIASPSPSTRPNSPTKPRGSRSTGSNSSGSSPIIRSSDGWSTVSSFSVSPTPTLALSSPSSPTKHSHSRVQPRALAMLRRDVDFVPLSPKKIRDTSQIIHSPRITPFVSPSMGRNSVEVSRTSEGRDLISDEIDDQTRLYCCKTPKLKSMDEKKEILGRLLGNVDALVDGVKKAGIWGLG